VITGGANIELDTPHRRRLRKTDTANGLLSTRKMDCDACRWITPVCPAARFALAARAAIWAQGQSDRQLSQWYTNIRQETGWCRSQIHNVRSTIMRCSVLSSMQEACLSRRAQTPTFSLATCSCSGSSAVKLNVMLKPLSLSSTSAIQKACKRLQPAEDAVDTMHQLRRAEQSCTRHNLLFTFLKVNRVVLV
jgi:hypothetical protein